MAPAPRRQDKHRQDLIPASRDALERLYCMNSEKSSSEWQHVEDATEGKWTRNTEIPRQPHRYLSRAFKDKARASGGNNGHKSGQRTLHAASRKTAQKAASAPGVQGTAVPLGPCLRAQK